ncbi:MAG TPA: siphovirus Gp157 family protein [Rhodothermales bacterium]|nr:siphovirus Gp157 family protein [Rhodothermales bacterium]
MSSIPPLSLYALDDELLALEAALVEAGGEIDDETDARFDALMEARTDKVEAYLRLIRRFEASADAVKAERQRLQAAERALAATAERLRDRLCDSMHRHGENDRHTPLGRVRVQTASRRPVELLVEAETLPELYQRVKVDADLRALADDLGSDDADVRTRAEAVARLGEPTYYLRIY